MAEPDDPGFEPQGDVPAPTPKAPATPPAFFPSKDCTPAPAAAVAAVSASRFTIAFALLGGFLTVAAES